MGLPSGQVAGLSLSIVVGVAVCGGFSFWLPQALSAKQAAAASATAPPRNIFPADFVCAILLPPAIHGCQTSLHEFHKIMNRNDWKKLLNSSFHGNGGLLANQAAFILKI
jgi:hypothetical protein